MVLKKTNSYLGNILYKPLSRTYKTTLAKNAWQDTSFDEGMSIEESRNTSVTSEIIPFFDFLNKQNTIMCSIGTRTGADELIFSQYIKTLYLIEPDEQAFKRLSDNFKSITHCHLINDVLQHVTLPEKVHFIYISNCMLTEPQDGISSDFFDFFDRNLADDGIVIFHEIGDTRFPHVCRSKFYLKALLTSSSNSNMTLNYYTPRFFFDYFSICDKKLHNVDYAKIRQTMITLTSSDTLFTTKFTEYINKYYLQLIKNNAITTYYKLGIFKRLLCFISLIIYCLRHLHHPKQRRLRETFVYNLKIILD